MQSSVKLSKVCVLKNIQNIYANLSSKSVFILDKL